jgi:hypothetical protein
LDDSSGGSSCASVAARTRPAHCAAPSAPKEPRVPCSGMCQCPSAS